jgi:hypothetical protein
MFDLAHNAAQALEETTIIVKTVTVQYTIEKYIYRVS